MNTSKLHTIAKALKDELSRVKAASLVNTLTQVLQNMINQPQQPSYQQELTNHLNTLYQLLEDSPVDNYSPAWRDTMEELKVIDEFGDNLALRLRGIFERNQITPQSALDEMKKLYEDLSGTEEKLEDLVNGLHYFGVGEDDLGPDECEIGIIIPRDYVHDNLKEFGLELVKLEKTLLVFSEIVTGQRKPLEIRQISSSELSVFLDYIPAVCACIAFAIERIVALYKQLLEIKKLKKELAILEVPEDNLSGIEDHATTFIKPKLDEIADVIIVKYGKDLAKNRKNELKIELVHSLYKLANRIDRGFNIELRVGEKEEEDSKDNEENPDTNFEARQQIIQSASRIEYLEHSGEPLLHLPDKEDKE